MFMPVLRYSMIYLNPASVPLRIPLGILPTPLESALAWPPSRNSFIRNTYKTPLQVLLLKDLNPFRCNTYRKSVRNSFRSNTYRKHRGYPTSHLSSPTLSPIRPQNRWDRLQQNPEVHPQAPILDVVQIQHHRGVERGIAPRLDLPQARDARLHIEPSKVLERVALVIVYRMWPRPH